MTVTQGGWTTEQLRDSFDRQLKAALEGQPPLSDSGLNYEVQGALATVALWYPAGEQHAEEARQAFRDQIDSQ